MNVFDFAIKMELDGKAFYEKLAKGTNIAGLQTIFSRLAADEQKHREHCAEAARHHRVIEEDQDGFHHWTSSSVGVKPKPPRTPASLSLVLPS